MSSPDADRETRELIERAARGESDACQQLLERHRRRLRQMVAVHLDRRVAARIDPSDVVQDALIDAYRELGDYLRERPLPFYPWLRQIAWDRLVALHHRHIGVGRRSVNREEQRLPGLADESVMQLAQSLVSSGTSPSRQVVRAELRERVRAAVERMAQSDREVLVMRHLEQLTIREIAALLRISEGAVKTRLTRALVRLRACLADCGAI
jgi:RNA polymerase sigma-70 factor (ECF subfamily)